MIFFCFQNAQKDNKEATKYRGIKEFDKKFLGFLATSR